MTRSELIINGIVTTLSEVSIINIRDVLIQEFKTVRATLSGKDWETSVDLAKRLIELDEVISSMNENVLNEVARSLPQNLEVEVKTDSDGVLLCPMSGDVLLDCLDAKCHAAIRLTIDSKDQMVRELGLYTVQISLGKNSFERKVWLVPTKNV